MASDSENEIFYLSQIFDLAVVEDHFILFEDINNRIAIAWHRDHRKISREEPSSKKISDKATDRRYFAGFPQGSGFDYSTSKTPA